ncbi:hypothetical protein EJB05_33410, partial [Eragrostis curvula]
MVMMAARRNTMGTPVLGKKKPRKPYTISRPREKWTADEHDRFVHALLIVGRDWKTIEQFVGTKTATQIRSHAQKSKSWASPPRCRRRTVLPIAGAADWAASCTLAAHDGSVVAGTSNSSEQAWVTDCSSQEDTFPLPLSPDDLRFAEVYKFVGDVFGSGRPWPVDAQLERLHGMDPVVAETILLVLRNLEDNLCY